MDIEFQVTLGRDEAKQASHTTVDKWLVRTSNQTSTGIPNEEQYAKEHSNPTWDSKRTLKTWKLQQVYGENSFLEMAEF